ncbi:hypothetical protein ASPFODRAFT_58303 [Aspergillus luchuensis CBS 106.47]|uniref:Uncharacterized protein n=1 Tax=Aspergillus luchuensis (strain CBS 106.47) TaxID=1137211 RepID=A0A1M3TRZ4_ASPLC|nr:hypothetical protein ASPFODRAFT_58303 [Aspergillus luchuensis CBS 106.47]
MNALAEAGLDGGVETKRRSVIVMEPVAKKVASLMFRVVFVVGGGGGGGDDDDDVDDVVNDGGGGFVLPYAYMFHCRSETSSRSTWRFSDADHSGSLRCNDRIGRTTTLLEEEWGKDEMTWYLPVQQLARVTLRWVLLPGEDPEILDELMITMMMLIQFHDPR